METDLIFDGKRDLLTLYKEMKRQTERASKAEADSARLRDLLARIWDWPGIATAPVEIFRDLRREFLPGAAVKAKKPGAVLQDGVPREAPGPTPAAEACRISKMELNTIDWCDTHNCHPSWCAEKEG